MARYKYTCPDVVHYRKNQYRLAYLTYALSCLPALIMWAGLKNYQDKLEAELAPPATTE